MDSHSTASALAIYIPALEFYCRRTSNIHSCTHVLQWTHQRHTPLDSYPIVGLPATYIPRLALYSPRTNNIHSWTHILQLAHQRYTSLDLHSTTGKPMIYNPGLHPTADVLAIYTVGLTFNSRRNSDIHS